MRRVALLVTLLLPAAAPAQDLALDMLVYPNAGVFESAPGKGPGGPGAAVLLRMQALSGVKLHQQLVPIPRALVMLKHSPGHCMVALTRTPERETQYRWAGPWARGATTVYARANDTRPVRQPQDLRGRSLVVLRDSGPADWLKALDLPMQAVSDNTTGLRMLQAGRVDHWIANDLAAQFVIRAEAGPAPRALFSLGRIDLYMACHPDSNPAAVAAVDAAIARMRRSGELAEFGLR